MSNRISMSPALMRVKCLVCKDDWFVIEKASKCIDPECGSKDLYTRFEAINGLCPGCTKGRSHQHHNRAPMDIANALESALILYEVIKFTVGHAESMVGICTKYETGLLSQAMKFLGAKKLTRPATEQGWFEFVPNADRYNEMLARTKAEEKK